MSFCALGAAKTVAEVFSHSNIPRFAHPLLLSLTGAFYTCFLRRRLVQNLNKVVISAEIVTPFVAGARTTRTWRITSVQSNSYYAIRIKGETGKQSAK